jgi:hypothetical protein
MRNGADRISLYGENRHQSALNQAPQDHHLIGYQAHTLGKQGHALG